jgi:hypothetical protein
MTITRRSLLKLLAGSGAAYLVPWLGQSAFAQTTKAVGKEVIAPPAAAIIPKLDGTVSYNAGWVINLEDRTELLEVEAKKTKLQEDKKAQKKPEQPIKTEVPITPSASAPVAAPQEPSKDWSTRWNKWVGKVKEWF